MSEQNWGQQTAMAAQQQLEKAQKLQDQIIDQIVQAWTEMLKGIPSEEWKKLSGPRSAER